MARVGDTFTIGELARRTGLPVKTIRFYSDEGLLPPTGRTHAGYRLYDVRAMARLELVKTLRELGMGLEDVEHALDGERSVSDIAKRHVAALDEQIRRLKLRRAVLRAVAKRGSELAEVKLMNRLASMSDDERRRLVDDFWDQMVAGLTVDSDFYRRMRSAKPDLPDDPTPEQLEAWIEFAELVADPDFRTLVRRMSEAQAAQIESGEFEATGSAQREHWCDWIAAARSAVEAGRSADSPDGRALADEVARASAPEGRDADSREWRTELANRFDEGADPRAERYWVLLGTINGWPPFPSQGTPVRFLIDALRASA